MVISNSNSNFATSHCYPNNVTNCRHGAHDVRSADMETPSGSEPGRFKRGPPWLVLGGCRNLSRSKSGALQMQGWGVQVKSPCQKVWHCLFMNSKNQCLFFSLQSLEQLVGKPRTQFGLSENIKQICLIIIWYL